MISFALILMTLPSRVAEVRARHGTSPSEWRTRRADRAGVPDSSVIESRFQRWRPDIGRIPGAVPQAEDDRRAFGAKKISFASAAIGKRSRE